MFLVDNSIQITSGTHIVSIQVHSRKIMDIKNVLHVPSLSKNLLLMCQWTQNGSSIEFHHTFCSLKLFTPRGKLIHLQCHLEKSPYTYWIWCHTSQQKWEQFFLFYFKWIKIHMKLSNGTIGWPIWIFFLWKIFFKKIVVMPILNFTQLLFCEGYNMGKHHKDFFSPISNETPSHAILDLVHSNICGPCKKKSWGCQLFYFFH
jgi:hypothetical protein